MAFFDVTFNVQKSVTLLHTAFEAQEVAARTAGDEETAQAWAAFRLGGGGRDLGGQQRRPGLPGRERRLLPRGTPRRRRRPVGRRPRLGRRVVLPARLPRSRPAPAHPQRAAEPGAGPGRGVAHARRAQPVPVAAGRRGGRRAHDRGAADPRARGAGRDPPGRQGPRGRRDRAGGDGPDLHAPPDVDREGRGTRRRVRGALRPCPERAAARAADAAGNAVDPPGEVAHRGDPRGAARPRRPEDPRRRRRRPGRGRARRARRPRDTVRCRSRGPRRR